LNFEGASWEEFSGEIRYELTGEEGGEFTLYFRFKDEAGNETEVYTYLVELELDRFELPETGQNVLVYVFLGIVLIFVKGEYKKYRALTKSILEKISTS